MDTGSHLLFGATLAGAAMIDPMVSSQPELFHAILAATMVGSHAPDLDTMARIKGYPTYIRIHRGFTHSLPALVLWPLLLTPPIAAGFGVWEHAVHVFVWCLIAVMLHVFMDWFNVYGVQCFRPFSSKWQHLDVLALFEPFLFGLHALGIGLWCLTSLPPGPLFLIIYGLTFAYIAFRTWLHGRAVSLVRRTVGEAGVYHVLPGLHWFRWQFVVETESYFCTGTLQGKRLFVQERYGKEADPLVVEATKTTDGVRAFLYFAQRVYVRCKERNNGYVVEWRDVRFWHKNELPFGVDVELDSNLNVVHTSFGWRKKAWDPPYV
ncbi:metal-dependent hydrolase [Paenibacillus rigui]|uniref:Hydrolase n=1 Tax=Paenibacillus rigui TaxID=554312 RepID=A0A229UXR6_9BACL|nr:metal-dependent hydrolase [Paenibacillus rigui]OXM87905.1 hydrolase [Paenibacillus rigui]